MTVLDICVELLKWFLHNDHFCLDEHFKKVILISENESYEKALVIAGLQRLEKQEIISSVTYGGKNIYILNKKLDAMEQDVTIDQETALKVSGVLNKFCDDIKDHKDVCDPTSLKQKDILHLALILESWQQQNIDNPLDG